MFSSGFSNHLQCYLFFLPHFSSILFISSLSTSIPHFFQILPSQHLYPIIPISGVPSPTYTMPLDPLSFFFFISFSFSLSQFLALPLTCHCLLNIFLLRKSLNFFSYGKFNLSINLLEQKALCTLVIKIQVFVCWWSWNQCRKDNA